MAKDAFTIEITPALQEVLGLQQAGGVDYFALLGTKRSIDEEGLIERCVLERSKALRKWQSSPQYGAEVVKLLGTLHKVSKLLKDPQRRQAYRDQLERFERGDVASAIDEFNALVRAAMADNMIDAEARRELARFASQNGIDSAEAQRIIAQVREAMKATRAAEAARPKEDDNWEFRIAEEGEEGFMLTLHGLENSGEFTETTPAKMLAQAGKYGLTTQRTAQIVADFQKLRFSRMIKRAASGGVVSEAQTRLLLTKAPGYGLDQRQAYEIIADYTLSVHSTEDALKRLALAETFDQGEIEKIVDNRVNVIRKKPALAGLGQLVPDWLRNLILIVLGGGALALLALYIASHFSSGGSQGVILGQGHAPADNAASPAQPSTAPSPPQALPGVPGALPPLTAMPDPATGLLTFKPERPGDPPAFEMAINEVTCDQYQESIRATLEAPPPSWRAGQGPPGPGNLPVTDITRKEALSFCAWLAGQRGWPVRSVTLPSQAEFLRAVNGRTTRTGDNFISRESPNLWERHQLGTGQGLAAVRQTRFDKIFLFEKTVVGERVTWTPLGQIYDLLGNAAEWGREDKDGKAAVLGGDYAQTSPDFNPLEARWESPDTRKPTIGFRTVHLLNP